jgi:hypothetical protein
VVRLVRETGKPIAQVARELGINEGRLATGAPRSVGITASRNNTPVMLP